VHIAADGVAGSAVVLSLHCVGLSGSVPTGAAGARPRWAGPQRAPVLVLPI